MPRFVTEFRWMMPYRAAQGDLPARAAYLTDWLVPEHQIPDDLVGVSFLISEHADPVKGALVIPADGKGVIRVTDISTGLDVTQDALRLYAEGELARTGTWPWWLSDIAPAYLNEVA